MNELHVLLVVFGSVGAAIAGIVFHVKRVTARARLNQAQLDEVVALFKAGEIDAATAALVDYDIDSPRLAAAAQQLAENGSPDLARKLLETALAEAPSSPQVLVHAASTLAQLEDEAGLVAQLQRAHQLELTPAHLLELGRLAAQQGLFEIAAGFYEARVKQGGREIDVATECAQVLLAANRPQEAIDLAEATLHELRRQSEGNDLFSGDPVYFEEMSAILFELHEHAVAMLAPKQTAVDGLASTGMLDPNSANNFRLLGCAALVDTERKPRRVIAPTQAQLESLAGRVKSSAEQEDRALFLLRDGRLDEAEALLRELVRSDPKSWPALIGLSAVLEARVYPPERLLREAISPPEVPLAAELVSGWAHLTDYEQGYVRLCLEPLSWAIERLLAGEGRMHVVSLDARITDVPPFTELLGTLDERGLAYDGLNWLVVDHCGVIRLDELYRVDPMHGWALANAFAHQALSVADPELLDAVEALWERVGDLGSGAGSPVEYFANAYERFVIRRSLPDLPLYEQHETDLREGVGEFFARVCAEAV